MRSTIAAIVLAVATGCLGWLYGDTNKSVRHPDPAYYQAALYSLHVRAIDSLSREVLDFQVRWDPEEVSPYLKGSGPAVEQDSQDGSKSIHVVGVDKATGLAFEISADGHLPAKIQVTPQSSGIRTGREEDLVTIELVKAEETRPGKGQPDPPVPKVPR